LLYIWKAFKPNKVRNLALIAVASFLCSLGVVARNKKAWVLSHGTKRYSGKQGARFIQPKGFASNKYNYRKPG